MCLVILKSLIPSYKMTIGLQKIGIDAVTDKQVTAVPRTWQQNASPPKATGKSVAEHVTTD